LNIPIQLGDGIWLQTVGSPERQHPPGILGGKNADLIQLPKLVLGETEFDRRETSSSAGRQDSSEFGSPSTETSATFGR
jgi:hypothetical protein